MLNVTAENERRAREEEEKRWEENPETRWIPTPKPKSKLDMCWEAIKRLSDDKPLLVLCCVADVFFAQGE